MLRYGTVRYNLYKNPLPTESAFDSIAIFLRWLKFRKCFYLKKKGQELVLGEPKGKLVKNSILKSELPLWFFAWTL